MKVLTHSNFETEETVANIISQMEPKTSTGLDGLSYKVIKMFGDVLSNPLSLLINKSYEEGIFPDRLKEAKIVSLHKSGKLTDPNNYRPISLLNTISKIFEK